MANEALGLFVLMHRNDSRAVALHAGIQPNANRRRESAQSGARKRPVNDNIPSTRSHISPIFYGCPLRRFLSPIGQSVH